MESLPYLERVKIQSEILLPLYRRLRDEIGEQQANAMLREAVREFAQALGEEAAASTGGTPIEDLQALVPMFVAGKTLDMEPVAQSATELSFDVKRCAYAEYFQQLGEPEFGAMLTCELDPAMTAGIGRGLTLKRTQTLLADGRACDFRWTVES